jgi:hypothetical protein
VSITVTMLLADHAQVADGKLYVNGGGWTVVDAATPGYSIALLLMVPWERAGRPVDLTLTLIDEDGHPVEAGNGAPIRISGRIEVQRPPAHPVGIPLQLPLVINVPALTLQPTSLYAWMLDIDGDTRDEWRLTFTTR